MLPLCTRVLKFHLFDLILVLHEFHTARKVSILFHSMPMNVMSQISDSKLSSTISLFHSDSLSL